MATVTARILQSQGLESAVGSLASRELGVTSDTERPVVGTTVGGPKFIGTEGLTLITTVAPSALTTLRRSRSIIYIDTATAGGDVALDIQAGAQVAGYKAEVVCVGPAGRKAVVTYGSGQVIAVPIGSSQEFEWSGSAWNIPQPSQALAIKTSIEYGRGVGDYFFNTERKSPAGWNPIDPSSYFPAICLTDFDTYQDISESNYPDLVSWLRARKIIYKDNISGSIVNPTVTNWAIAANIATLTFTNNASHIAFLSALLEDEILHGSYVGWRAITIIASIGPIVAGDYALTNVNASARTVSFQYAATNGSGSGSWSTSFYANRIAGSTTTARLFSLRGLSLHGASDDNGYLLNGLRRRGYMQGHWHTMDGEFSGRSAAASTWTTNQYVAGRDFGSAGSLYARDPYTDGVNGTPRSAKETNSPLQATHIFMHARRYLP